MKVFRSTWVLNFPTSAKFDEEFVDVEVLALFREKYVVRLPLTIFFIF